MLTGCEGRITAIPVDESLLSTANETLAPPDHSNLPVSDDDSDDVVTLLVYGDWDDEKNVKNEDVKYTLLDKHSVIITELFNNHEKEISGSPIESIASLQFQVGADYLATSMGSLGTLSGRIGGELVVMELDESECETIYQIISTYVPDITGIR
jgi:hypothetical protein